MTKFVVLTAIMTYNIEKFIFFKINQIVTPVLQ